METSFDDLCRAHDVLLARLAGATGDELVLDLSGPRPAMDEQQSRRWMRMVHDVRTRGAAVGVRIKPVSR